MTHSGGRNSLSVVPISRSDVIWWTSTSFLGLGLFTFPRDLSGPAGLGAWYGLVIQQSLAAFAVWLIARLMQPFPGRTAVDVAVQTMGLFGRLFELAMGTIMLTTLTVAYGSFGTLVHESTLPQTPQAVIVGALAFVVWYGASQGVRPVTRTLQFTTPILVVCGVFVFSLTFGDVKGTFLIPHWTGILPIVTGVYHDLFILAGLQNLFIYNAHIEERPYLRCALLGLAINTGILALLMASTIGNFGVDALTWITWPGAFLAKAIDLSGFYIERIGLLVLLAWVGWVSLFLINTTLTASIAVAQILGLGSERFRWIVPWVVGVPAVTSLLVSGQNTMEYLAVTWVAPLTLFMLFGKPLILGLAVRINKRARQRLVSGNSQS